jgi:hypothetical protein
MQPALQNALAAGRLNPHAPEKHRQSAKGIYQKPKSTPAASIRYSSNLINAAYIGGSIYQIRTCVNIRTGSCL